MFRSLYTSILYSDQLTNGPCCLQGTIKQDLKNRGQWCSSIVPKAIWMSLDNLMMECTHPLTMRFQCTLHSRALGIGLYLNILRSVNLQVPYELCASTESLIILSFNRLSSTVYTSESTTILPLKVESILYNKVAAIRTRVWISHTTQLTVQLERSLMLFPCNFLIIRSNYIYLYSTKAILYDVYVYKMSKYSKSQACTNTFLQCVFKGMHEESMSMKCSCIHGWFTFIWAVKLNSEECKDL